MEEQEIQQNHVLQENGRDYKSIDGSQNATSNQTNETQTEAIVDEINEPARLVSSTSTEETSGKLLLTTALSTSVSTEVTALSNPSSTTARAPTSYRSTQNYSNASVKRFYPSSSATMSNSWRLRNFSDNQQSPSSPFQSTNYYSSPVPTSMVMARDKWKNKSGCYYSCLQQATGLQTVTSKFDLSTNIQLCEPVKVVCTFRIYVNQL